MKKQDFDQHVKNVFKNAKHHARKVEGVILPLAYVVFMKSQNIVSARKSKFENGITNPIKFRTIDNKDYYLGYNHEIEKITLKKKNSRGEILAQFDNTNIDSIVEIFESL